MIRATLNQIENDEEDFHSITERVKELEKEVQYATNLPGSEKAENLLADLEVLDPNAKKRLGF